MEQKFSEFGEFRNSNKSLRHELKFSKLLNPIHAWVTIPSSSNHMHIHSWPFGQEIYIFRSPEDNDKVISRESVQVYTSMQSSVIFPI